jgi:hypothetical protein
LPVKNIRIDSLRRHHPFTPSFIGRAEDQALKNKDPFVLELQQKAETIARNWAAGKKQHR